LIVGMVKIEATSIRKNIVASSVVHHEHRTQRFVRVAETPFHVVMGNSLMNIVNVGPVESHVEIVSLQTLIIYTGPN